MEIQSDTSKSKHLAYNKRSGSSSVTGQLYETKLLSLFLLRLLNKKDIDEFYLGTNVNNIGPLDDICFKYRTTSSNEYVSVFLQVKHKLNPNKGKITMKDLLSSVGDFSLEKHFESYLKIREKIQTTCNDIMFQGPYYRSTCYFVVYTPLKHDIAHRKNIKHNNEILNELLQTNNFGDMIQFDYRVGSFLIENYLKKHYALLGKKFIDLILGNDQNTSDHQLVTSYHIVLAQHVVELTDIGDGIQKWKFRQDFFDNKDSLIKQFRRALTLDALKTETLNPIEGDVKAKLISLSEERSTKNIMEIIGNIVDYDTENNVLLLVDKFKKNQELNFFEPIKEAHHKVLRATKQKAKNVLQKMEFVLPNWFGNKDLMIFDTTEKTLDFLASSFVNLFERAIPSEIIHMIEIDNTTSDLEKMIDGAVFANIGGLGSAIGNLLKWDKETRALKFNMHGYLPEKANKLLSMLKTSIDPQVLTKYRFKFCLQGFPKASLDDCIYEEYLVKDFIARYWVYTDQAQEDGVEFVCRKEITEYVKTHIESKPIFKAKTDAMFLKIHDEMQKWWMQPNNGIYLTKDTIFLRKAILDIVECPLLSILNAISINRVTNNAVDINLNEANSFPNKNIPPGLVLIVTDAIKLTVLKVLSIEKYSQNSAVIDFNYTIDLFFCKLEELAFEISNGNLNTIVILCKTSNNIGEGSPTKPETLIHFVHSLQISHIIIITDEKFSLALKQDLEWACCEINDNKNSLLDMCTTTQTKMLDEYKIIYQGEEVQLKCVIDYDSKHLITPQVIDKIMNNEIIEIGTPLTTSAYDDIKEFYISRKIWKRMKDPNTNDVSSIQWTVETLDQAIGDFTVIMGPPGIGKSTELTHLSLKTKELNPKMWIVRINLLDHSKQLHDWKIKQHINKLEILQFFIKVITNGQCEYELTFKDNEVVLEKDKHNASELLQVEIFMNCLNKGWVIFLFDGFDEICPLYDEIAIKLIKLSYNLSTNECGDGSVKHKVWITSRPYNNIVHIMEKEFGLIHKLSGLQRESHELLLHKVWQKNLNVEQFTTEQLLNLNSFITYMQIFSRDRVMIRMDSVQTPIYEMYTYAMEYFQNAVRNLSQLPKYPTFKDLNSVQIMCSRRRRHFPRSIGPVNYELSFLFSSYKALFSPLYTIIIAHYFSNQILYNLSPNDHKWDVQANGFFVYEQFIETKLIKIRFEEKNRINIYITLTIDPFTKESGENS